jgi:hypothetical protein
VVTEDIIYEYQYKGAVVINRGVGPSGHSRTDGVKVCARNQLANKTLQQLSRGKERRSLIENKQSV